MNVTLINYGMGNLWSVQTAIRKIGYVCDVTSDHIHVSSARTLILPGVGSFHLAMSRLKQLHLDQAIYQALSQGAKILGICLGMQLLCKSSTEDQYTHGLGLVDLAIDQIALRDTSAEKTTHVGFNTVYFPENSSLSKDLGDHADFYFVHSFCARNSEPAQRADIHFCYAYLDQSQIVAGFESSDQNIYGVQFHPEKSQSNGLKLIANFLDSH